MRSYLFCLLVLLILTGAHPTLVAQPVSAVPLVKNYPKQMHGGGTQTWDICEGRNGIVYFANNNGLLLFDGKKFTKYPLPKNTILRSLYFDAEMNRIYAGGQNEIGYFAYSKQGILHFVSLENLLPAGEKGFEDVWGIEQSGDKIYFQTSRQVFAYNGKSIESLKPTENTLENLHLVGTQLFLTDATGKVYELLNQQFREAFNTPELDISSLLPFGEKGILITTYKNGIYLYKNGLVSKAPFEDAQLKESRIYRACSYGNYLVLATNRSGIYLMDTSGKIVNHMSMQDGLQNNNVLSLFSDQNKNLWLGLDNGIDLLRLNYPFGYVFPDGLLKGTGYCMAELGAHYYFGTNNGLYVRSIQNSGNPSFQLVSNTEGQVWWVQEIEGKMYACHHEGLYEVTGSSAKKISALRGCWKLLPLKSKPGFYIMGTYNGLAVFKWENKSLVLVSKLGTFKESSRFLEEDEQGNIWVGHPYKGLYRIETDQALKIIKQVKRYGTQEGLPAATENYVFNTDLGLCFATSKGVYSYLPNKDRFEPFQTLGFNLPTNQTFKRVFMGKNGKIWYISQEEIACLKPDYNGVDYTYTKLSLPKLDQNLVGGFEFLQECSNNHIFLGVETGFVHFNLPQIKDYVLVPPRVLLTGISSLNEPDSVYYRYTQNNETALQIKDRSLEFSFSSPNGHYNNELSFSSYLEGWEKDWSPWKTAESREFSRLSYGNYTLHVKARSMGMEGPETFVKIIIPAPWFWSSAAKFIYALLAILVVLLIGFYPQMLVRKKASRIIAEKDDHFKRQTELLRMEKEKQEHELIELRNQQLQKELEHHGRELASSTMHIVQKSEMLLSIKDRLKRITQVSNDPKIKPEINELIKNIEKDTLIDRDWEKFELYFNHIHDSYTQILKEKFPVLTANDIKMCAYLRMNLSTKEIATILNISTRGVEISRYRLRKKMGLENGVNLTEYLSKL